MLSRKPGDVTQLLEAWSQGEPQAEEELMSVVFDELRLLAAGYLGKERPDHTLQPTALVNEAYLRLVDQRQENWNNRGHFFAVAAKMMRRILVDHARSRRSGKRGAGVAPIPLAEVEDFYLGQPTDLLALDDALVDLAAFDAQKASIVELRFFVGMNLQEISEALDCSTATVTRHWRAARAWLYQQMCPKELA